MLHGFRDGIVINELIRGLEIPSTAISALSRCPRSEIMATSTSSTGNNTNEAVPGSDINAQLQQVLFGYDIASGCTLSLSRQELIDFCCAGAQGCTASSGDSASPYSDPTTGLPYFFDFTPGYGLLTYMTINIYI